MSKIIGMFDKYFITLVLIESCITILDSHSFKKSNMMKSYKQAKYIGIFILVTSFILYIAQKILS
ncbi:hypothetical protein NRP93_000231 [Clostridium botulinum]|nr:hypothetical protein [Clostridium botulinum]